MECCTYRANILRHLLDRWILRNLYTSGGDAGFFWALTDKDGKGLHLQVMQVKVLQ